MKKLLLLLSLSCASSLCAFGQGVTVAPQTAFKVVNGLTTPIANAAITVCAANTGGFPCSPALANSIFKDTALTVPLSNPFFADANGNYQFAIAPGNYTVTVTNFGFAGQSYQLTVATPISLAGGLGDPGANGPIFRNGLNTTRPAASADVIALFSGSCSVATILRGDGSCAPGGNPAGSDQQLQFNNSAAFGGASGLTWNSGTSIFGIAAPTDFTAQASPGNPAAGKVRAYFDSTSGIETCLTSSGGDACPVLKGAFIVDGVRYATVQAALNAVPSTGGIVFVPAGTYTSSSALTINTANTTLWCAPATILQFTGATDGVVIADASPLLNHIRIDGCNIQTTNAAGGKALSFNTPLHGTTENTVIGVRITVSGSGFWSYGIFGDNFQTSAIYSTRVLSSATVSFHFQHSSNAVSLNTVEGDGGTGVNRCYEIQGPAGNESEIFITSGTCQGAFAQSVAYVQDGSFATFSAGFHDENINATPSDGADLIDNASTVNLTNVNFADVLTMGTNPLLRMTNSAAHAVTLGNSPITSTITGSTVTSITDNNSATYNNVFLANKTTGGADLPNKLFSYFLRPDSSSVPQITGSQKTADAPLGLANNSWFFGLKSGGTLLHLFSINTGDNTVFQYGAGKAWILQNETGSVNPIFVNDSLTAIGNQLRLGTTEATLTNCASAGGTCSASIAGRVSIAAAATTVTVSTTTVTANSEIFVQFDETLGTALSVTCNNAAASEAAQYFVSARTAATSFTIKTSVAPTTNPACLSYRIVN
ncbi:MAG: hypothetical protein JWO19_4432 [Bryobacterales bacterium]|nr:hypothetical protein [Bryobacterales bacterium]